MSHATLSALRLVKDARAKIVQEYENSSKQFNIVSIMNDLIVESAMNSTWKYSTPTLFVATAHVHKKITGEVTSGYVIPNMDRFATEIGEFCAKKDSVHCVLIALDQVINDLEHEYRRVEK